MGREDRTSGVSGPVDGVTAGPGRLGPGKHGRCVALTERLRRLKAGHARYVQDHQIGRNRRPSPRCTLHFHGVARFRQPFAQQLPDQLIRLDDEHRASPICLHSVSQGLGPDCIQPSKRHVSVSLAPAFDVNRHKRAGRGTLPCQRTHASRASMDRTRWSLVGSKPVDNRGRPIP